ncbi:hypothetical protein G6F65_011664 [Rhizopus arrhizus]|nr:hypothetical protein G6F65_011664 [Rhizopus arrhizus]
MPTWSRAESPLALIASKKRNVPTSLPSAIAASISAVSKGSTSVFCLASDVLMLPVPAQLVVSSIDSTGHDSSCLVVRDQLTTAQAIVIVGGDDPVVSSARASSKQRYRSKACRTHGQSKICGAVQGSGHRPAAILLQRPSGQRVELRSHRIDLVEGRRRRITTRRAGIDNLACHGISLRLERLFESGSDAVHQAVGEGLALRCALEKQEAARALPVEGAANMGIEEGNDLVDHRLGPGERERVAACPGIDAIRRGLPVAVTELDALHRVLDRAAAGAGRLPSEGLCYHPASSIC